MKAACYLIMCERVIYYTDYDPRSLLSKINSLIVLMLGVLGTRGKAFPKCLKTKDDVSTVNTVVQTIHYI